MSSERPPSFAPIDWQAAQGGRGVSASTAFLLFGGLCIAGLYAYDRYIAHVYLVFDWRVDLLDWLFLLAVVVFVAYVVIPAIAHRRRTVRIWRRFRTNTGAVVALCFLAVVLIAGLLAPVVRPPSQHLQYTMQPPIFFSVPEHAVTGCVAAVQNGQCRGTLWFPLGTDHLGRDVLAMTLAGARIAAVLGFIAAMLVIPLATLVGVVAGFHGGRLDTLFMTGIDVQQTLPVIIIYVLLVSLSSRSLALFVVLFGLFSWGSAARLIRSETRQRATRGYVLAARNMGASDVHIARRHVLPNVSNAVVTAAAHLVPVLILTEAAIAFLDLTGRDLFSWGRIIAEATNPQVAPVWEQWWVSVPAIVLLTGTVIACKVVGDGLRDALDPRGKP